MEELSNTEPQLALDAAKIYEDKDEPMTNEEEVGEITQKYG